MAKSQEWHDRRRCGIGGSDAPVIILGNEHPFSNPYKLWQDKMGLLAPIKETPPMQRGTALESIIRKIYAEKTGRTVINDKKHYRHPVHDFMLGETDGWIEAERGKGILEVKCPNMATYLKCKREGPLDYYIIQLQHYMAVLGAKWGSFAIFNAELWELTTYDLERDDDFIEILIGAESEFWDNVLCKTPPTDNKTAQRIKLPETTERGEVTFIEDENWNNIVDEFSVAWARRKEAEERENLAKEKLKEFMAINEFSLAEGHGLRVHYKKQEGRQTFDHKGFVNSHKDMDLSPWYKKGEDTMSFRTYFLKGEEDDE